MTTEQEHLDRLTQRRDWLTARIAAKQSIGWDVQYDRSERDALAWVLEKVQQAAGIQRKRSIAL